MEPIKQTMQKMGLAVPSPRTTLDQWQVADRPWLKRVRLSQRRGLAVRQIADQWEADSAYTTNIEQAVLLYDAVLRADLDVVRQIAPLLVAALQPAPKRRHGSPSYKNQSIKREGEKGEEEEEIGRDEDELKDLAAALAEVTDADWMVSSEARNLVYSLCDAEVRADNLRVYGCQFAEQDWRGKRGEKPTLKEVRDHAAGIRRLVLTGQEPGASPYLNDEYFHRHTMDDQIEPDCTYALEKGKAELLPERTVE